MENFEKIFNETYNTFYNACTKKELLSKQPIPFTYEKLKNSNGQYKEENLFFDLDFIKKENSLNKIKGVIYHELTHFYDNKIFTAYNYSIDEMETLSLTFSEIHASYNEILALFNIFDLRPKRKIKLNQIAYDNYLFSQIVAFRVALCTVKESNILDFKKSMYFLGYKRAFLQLAADPLAITKAFSNKHISKNVYEFVINIDKLVDFCAYDKIDVDKIRNNKLKAENELSRNSFINLMNDIPDDIKNEIHNIFGL